jgi:hypothetical protein
MAIAFSSAVSQRAVSGRSVGMKNAMNPMIVVIMPEIRNIISHRLTDPILLIFKMPLGSDFGIRVCPAINRQLGIS